MNLARGSSGIGLRPLFPRHYVAVVELDVAARLAHEGSQRDALGSDLGDATLRLVWGRDPVDADPTCRHLHLVLGKEVVVHIGRIGSLLQHRTRFVVVVEVPDVVEALQVVALLVLVPDQRHLGRVTSMRGRW